MACSGSGHTGPRTGHRNGLNKGETTTDDVRLSFAYGRWQNRQLRSRYAHLHERKRLVLEGTGRTSGAATDRAAMNRTSSQRF